MAHSTLEQSKPQQTKATGIGPDGQQPQTGQSKRLRQLANMIESEMSDLEPAKQRIKTLSMGGSYCDSAFRLTLTALSLTTFSFFAFHLGTEFRKEKGLIDCITADTQDQPVVGDLVADSETLNVSKHWLLLYYVHIGAGVYTILQIIVATVAF